MLSTDFPNYFKDLFHIKENFLGCFSIDTIPKKFCNKNFAIVNTDLSSNPGQHWFVIFKSDQDEIEIFDSLGANINLLRDNFTPEQKLSVVFNQTCVQLQRSQSCGQFVIYFIINRFFNYDLTFFEFLNEYFTDDLEENESIIEEFCKEIREND